MLTMCKCKYIVHMINVYKLGGQVVQNRPVFYQLSLYPFLLLLLSCCQYFFSPCSQQAGAPIPPNICKDLSNNHPLEGLTFDSFLQKAVLFLLRNSHLSVHPYLPGDLPHMLHHPYYMRRSLELSMKWNGEVFKGELLVSD